MAAVNGLLRNSSGILSSKGARRSGRRGRCRQIAVFSAESKAVTTTKENPSALLNSVTVAVASSPLNAGKLWLAKKQAGDYDVEVVTKKVNKLINNGGITMFR